MASDAERLEHLYHLLDSGWNVRIAELEEENLPGMTLILSRDIDDEILDLSSDFLQNTCHVFETEDYEIRVYRHEENAEIRFKDIETGADAP